ncbi:MAG: hypothetical protein H7641_13295 [Candidatus Heimdallarchaeota archaeon]|nr:hypothetical protein [Candidatus Heimdallarchaeota archaeon]MCK4878536.1 hypothetical protein [Candidatus Heimdallarchaeota archaeon]
MEKDAFIMQLRQMIEIKEKISELLTNIQCCPGNSLLEALIHGMGLDAKKHAEIFRGLLDRAQGINEAIEEDYKDSVLDAVDKVLELEWNISNQLKNVVDRVTDEKTKRVMTTVLGDVQRHEVTLKYLKDFVETMTEDEENVVDKIWKYSIKFDE